MLFRFFVFLIIFGIISALVFYSITWLFGWYGRLKKAQLKKWHNNKEKEVNKKIKQLNRK